MSKQRDWQRKQQAAGNCVSCGKPRSGDARQCTVCRDKRRVDDRARKRSNPWRKGGPGRPPLP
jgi:hypothetical protein